MELVEWYDLREGLRYHSVFLKMPPVTGYKIIQTMENSFLIK